MRTGCLPILKRKTCGCFMYKQVLHDTFGGTSQTEWVKGEDGKYGHSRGNYLERFEGAFEMV